MFTEEKWDLVIVSTELGLDLVFPLTLSSSQLIFLSPSFHGEIMTFLNPPYPAPLHGADLSTIMLAYFISTQHQILCPAWISSSLISPGELGYVVWGKRIKIQWSECLVWIVLLDYLINTLPVCGIAMHTVCAGNNTTDCFWLKDRILREHIDKASEIQQEICHFHAALCL